MLKKKIVIPLVVSALLAGSVLGTSLAYLKMDTNNRVNLFSVNKTSQGTNAYIREPLWDQLSEQAKILYPNENIIKDPRISYESPSWGTSDRTVPIFVYMRVTVPYRPVRTVSDKTVISNRTPQSLFSYDINPGWKEIGEGNLNEAQTLMVHTYAYVRGALKPGEQTPPLFTSIHYLNVVEGDVPQGEKLDINISSMAVQEKGPWTGTSTEEKILSAYKTLFA